MTARPRTAFGLILLLAVLPLAAQEPVAPAADPAAAPADPGVPKAGLSDEQAAIRVRFARVEDTLLKMTRYLQKTEPARAELVLRAYSRGKEERIAERMALVAGMLGKEGGGTPRYADALQEQEATLAAIRELLTILRSEDILDENRKEQERLKEFAREIAALIDREKVHQASTQRGEPTDRIADGQQKTAEKTDEVNGKIDAHDRARSAKKSQGDEKKPGDGAAEGKEGGPKVGSEKGTEGKEGAEPKDGSEGKEGSEGKPESKEGSEPKDGSESKPGEQGKEGSESKEGSPGKEGSEGKEGAESKEGGENKPGQSGQSGQPGQSGQSGEPGQQTPGREQLEQARKAMERAIEQLKKESRGGATKEQEEAIRKLIEAKEKIEELLRQLREEERELLLRALEARFQKMLQLQQTVLETTVDLGGAPLDQWQDREYARVRSAAATEREIAVEADKALEVLRADGSSVAFPEAVEQLRGDIGEVVERLGRDDAGELTVAIERDIVEALQEMILAFQKEMEKLREQKGQKGQQSSQPQDPALVDKLAELKMLRTLQMRINRRTDVLGRLIDGEQATAPDVVAQLRELADRQRRLQQATYDLATGKTTQ